MNPFNRRRKTKYVEGKPVLVKIKPIEMLAMFTTPEKQQRVHQMFNEEGVDAMVIFMNDKKDSIEYGAITALKIGPKQKVKTLDDCNGRFMGNIDDNTAKVALFYCPKA